MEVAVTNRVVATKIFPEKDLSQRRPAAEVDAVLVVAEGFKKSATLVYHTTSHCEVIFRDC